MTLGRHAGIAVFLVATCVSLCGSNSKKTPVAKVIRLESAGKDYLRVLGGPPETVTMRSGLVVLRPGKSVGLHNTEANEELLVVLEGAGEMRLPGSETLPVAVGTAVYCPPHREHDVFNTGSGLLRYVYVVAKAVKD